MEGLSTLAGLSDLCALGVGFSAIVCGLIWKKEGARAELRLLSLEVWSSRYIPSSPMAANCLLFGKNMTRNVMVALETTPKATQASRNLRSSTIDDTSHAIHIITVKPIDIPVGQIF